MSSKKLFIITGANRGLGHALVTHALRENANVITVSRAVAAFSKQVTQIQHDLSSLQGLEQKLRAVVDLSASEVILINNAAVLGPVGKITSNSDQDIQLSLTVNLQAPILLTKLVMQLFDSSRKRCIVNISSGAAFVPIEAWGMYCTTKAGLKMFSENLRFDFQNDHNLRVLNFSPGVMDTGMQEQIRSLDEKTFSRVGEFRNFKSEGTLLTPDFVAKKLLNYLSANQSFENVNLDIRDLN